MQSSAASLVCGKQPLNPLDRALRTVDQVIRELGYPGFETQMIVWLAGRVDAAKLRRTITRLGRHHPVITGRLVEAGPDSDAPHWQFRPDAPAALEELELPTNDRSAVTSCAEALLSTPCDPASFAPLRFYLLHRPAGRDVLLLQYNHVLMENRSAHQLLRELDRLFSDSANCDGESYGQPTDLFRRRLKRVSAAERRVATLRAIEVQRTALRGGVAILGKGAKHSTSGAKLKIATRELEAPETRAITTATVRLCGLPSLSMAILACTFRAMEALDQVQRSAGRNYVAGIGLDMGVGGQESVRLQNLLSVVPIIARSGELANQQALIQLLSRQMRDRLESKIDLGILNLVAIFQRRPQHIQMVLEHLLRCGFSLWYAYFGSADFRSEELFGQEVKKVCYVGPTWLPMGISLLANQFRGRLLFQATYDPDVISESLANDFLDRVMADLLALSSVEGEMA